MAAMALSRLPPWLWRRKVAAQRPPSPPLSPSSSSSSSSATRDVAKDAPSPVRKRTAFRKSPTVDTGLSSVQSMRRASGRRRSDKQRLDPEFDMVLVPVDGGCCLSGSDSDDSDWSVGWFEPHAPEFLCDDDPDNSFSVLVPCYGSPSSDVRLSCRRGRISPQDGSRTSQLWAAVLS
eukprot:c24339_g1_i2 orf=1-528(-)